MTGKELYDNYIVTDSEKSYEQLSQEEKGFYEILAKTADEVHDEWREEDAATCN